MIELAEVVAGAAGLIIGALIVAVVAIGRVQKAELMRPPLRATTAFLRAAYEAGGNEWSDAQRKAAEDTLWDAEEALRK